MLRLLSLATLGLALCSACAPEIEVELARPLPSASGSGGSGGSSGAAGAGGTENTGGSTPQAGAGDGGEPPSPPTPRILADSVADFSLTQGKYGWYYGSDGGDLESFTLLTRIDTITAFEPPSGEIWDCWASDATHWTQIFRLGAHPNGTGTSSPSKPLLERAVRRWVSDFAGDVVLSGEVAKIDVVDSNGVVALVFVDKVQLFEVAVEGDDSAGVSYQVPATVSVGSTVDFVLDPREGKDHHDLSRFTAIIARAETGALP